MMSINTQDGVKVEVEKRQPYIDELNNYENIRKRAKSEADRWFGKADRLGNNVFWVFICSVVLNVVIYLFG